MQIPAQSRQIPFDYRNAKGELHFIFRFMNTFLPLCMYSACTQRPRRSEEGQIPWGCSWGRLFESSVRATSALNRQAILPNNLQILTRSEPGSCKAPSRSPQIRSARTHLSQSTGQKHSLTEADLRGPAPLLRTHTQWARVVSHAPTGRGRASWVGACALLLLPSSPCRHTFAF